GPPRGCELQGGVAGGSRWTRRAPCRCWRRCWVDGEDVEMTREIYIAVVGPSAGAPGQLASGEGAGGGGGAGRGGRRAVSWSAAAWAASWRRRRAAAPTRAGVRWGSSRATRGWTPTRIRRYGWRRGLVARGR